MNKHFAANFFNLLIVVMIIIAAGLYWAKAEFYKPGPLKESLFIEVPRGGSMNALSKTLQQEGAISHGIIMRVGSDYLEKSSQLKFGNYEIPKGSSIADILDIVTKGGGNKYRYVARYKIKVTGEPELVLRERSADNGDPTVLASYSIGQAIPKAYSDLIEEKKPISYQVSIAEGVTSWQLVQSLNSADFLDGEITTIPSEGSLSPNTYEVRRGTLRTEVLSLMQTAQDNILTTAWANRAKGLPLKSPQEALILASIVEKETGVGAERSEVAGVFVNRLNKGMKLQTDPTVIYGITNGKEPLGRGLRRSELSKKTDYNTYIIPALPPGPIANPGRAAIEAALNPAQTDNLFFVADGTGGHVFSRNLAEHNANVAKWRKIEAQRKKDLQKSKESN